MRIEKTAPPPDSLIASAFSRADYVDAFRGSLPSGGATLEEALKAFFRFSPAWISAALDLRNRLTRKLGLKAPPGTTPAEREAILRDLVVEPGLRVGLFRVFDMSEREVLAGEDDKHLDFRVSFLLDPPRPVGRPQTLTVTTSVRIHNRLGRVYFAVVKPFHRLVVPAMLRGMIRGLENGPR